MRLDDIENVQRNGAGRQQRRAVLDRSGTLSGNDLILEGPLGYELMQHGAISLMLPSTAPDMIGHVAGVAEFVQPQKSSLCMTPLVS